MLNKHTIAIFVTVIKQTYLSDLLHSMWGNIWEAISTQDSNWKQEKELVLFLQELGACLGHTPKAKNERLWCPKSLSVISYLLFAGHHDQNVFPCPAKYVVLSIEHQCCLQFISWILMALVMARIRGENNQGCSINDEKFKKSLVEEEITLFRRKLSEIRS